MAGDEITVTYTPLGMLADEPELVLRGTYGTADDKSWRVRLDERLLTIPTMNRGSGGTFATRFTLPEAAVYAAFVVEDATGEQLDAKSGRLFDLLVHAPDDRPLYHAFRRRADEFEDRNVHTSLEALRRAMELYPDSLGGWSELRSFERSALGWTTGDSLFAWHQENFAELHERYKDREEGLSPSAIQGLSSYAAAVRDQQGTAHWDAAAEQTVGTDAWAMDTGWRILNQLDADGDTTLALAEFERHWPDAREALSPFEIFGFELALEARDLDALDRWIERFFPYGMRGLALPRMIAVIPERRARAVELARVRYELPDPGRPLGRTADEHAQSVAVERAALLKDYARFLNEYASPDEAMEIVEEATTRSASSDLFEILGELKLDAGDVEGAARAYAALASDPSMSPEQADSLAMLVGHDPDSPKWRALLEAGTVQVLPNVLSAAVEWTPGDARVTDASGNQHTLADLTGGKPTVLIFWARWCPPCVQKIPAVVRLEAAMERLGAQVLSIAWRDPPGAEMDAFIEERGITYPVYYDLADDATGAFGVYAIQANFVLDPRGRVRFERSAIVDIPRQVGALKSELLEG
ncbi:peroxiredoxin family protein [Candidatus Palauibacter sp.]|uniref:peroxiredoxin family protein n=1 Tax=Candidatus Palauibacter sp. TaxID=3101350 RepID=UPI003C6EAF07